ncbi:MAG: phosphoglycerate transporter protein PgtP [Rhabdochlamydiaceae bacterium]|nr:phosphoglycerate transporter protein PgtP [Candidatus Amphrikana amoebophyrae]
MFSIFKAASHVNLIEDKDEVRKKYRYWRLRIFFGMYIGYAFFYLSRKSLTYILPVLMTSFNWTMADVGLFGSILYITYGLSKFLSGIIGDKSNPRYFMSIGLLMTGVLNVVFGASSSFLLFAFIWGLNGIFQGWGWPPCARLLTHWYHQSERGAWWGVWNTSHNVGGLIILWLAPPISIMLGWRAAMYLPGVICILGGFFLLFCLRDTPQSLGLPPIEKRNQVDDGIDVEKIAPEKELSTKEILFKYVLKNKFIWTLAVAYFFIYVIRTAVNDWGLLFLINVKGLSHLKAGIALGLFEIGGLCGSLVAGVMSDRVYNGRRGPVNVIYSASVIFALALVWFIPNASFWLASTSIFIIGFLIFGPQMLIGMAAAELSHKKAAGTATGFAGWFGYAGAAAGAYPFGLIATKWGWQGFFIGLAAAALLSVLILIPLWSIKSAGERDSEQKLEEAAS